MGVRLSSLAVTAAALLLLLLAAPSAHASCENRGFIDFGGTQSEGGGTGRGGDGGAAAEPGATMTLRGERFEPGSVSRVRIGNQGEVVAQATADAAGSWVATFTLDREIREGTYIVQADAFHSSGELVIATTSLTVKRPAGAPGSQQQPQAAPVPQATPAADSQAVRSGPPIEVGVSEPRAQAPATASPSATASAQPATTATTSEAAPAREARARDGASAPGADARTRRADVPTHEGATAFSPSDPVVRGTARAPRFGEPGDHTPIFIVGAVLLAAVAAGYALARRGPPKAPAPAAPAPPSGPEPGAVPVPDAVEAALQEMIAEERAREADRPAELVG